MSSPSLLDANFFDDRSRVCQYVQFFLSFCSFVLQTSEFEGNNSNNCFRYIF